MVIDLIVLIAVILALVKGYSKGIIMALFNTLSLIIALAAAVKFSAMVSPVISEKLDTGVQFTPILSFLVVFVAFLLVIRFAGKALEKTFEAASIGFINRVSGALLYLLVYIAVLSVLFYYIEKTGMIRSELQEHSVTWAWIMPWGPAVLDGIGLLIPFFKDMFEKLNGFFEQVTTGNEANA